MSGSQQALLAATGGGVSLTNKTITGMDNKVAAACSASATFTLKATGAAIAVTSGNASNPPAGTTDYSPQWMLSGPSSQYEARATLQAGALSSGTTGTWQPLSADVSWNCASSATAGGGQVVATATLLVEIRLAAGGTVLTGNGATVVLRAECNSG